MKRVQYGDGDRRLVVVLGWGNRPEHDGVQWLVDQLTTAGYCVDVFELPRTIEDFEAEYLEPVEQHLAELDTYRLLSHSTGGLITRYVSADDGLETRTYLSPWWGFHEGLQNPIVSSLMRVPIARPILPVSTTRSDLGELASDEWVEDSPSYAAPTFLREAKRAQASMPPFDDRDAVFYNPDDPIVSGAAIEADAPAANRVSFDGGHELFNSRSRDDHIDALLGAIDGGIDGMDD
ncbi:alpha/beta hydrolase [Salinarchaeum laminariae]|uniref:alpha/beta hydrolase n=1 Tax=Salinarchaeum laminariae TaxID=869888 RepID=UPI0020C17E3B|nr:alpha/beta hydrolase [Salinarchaeum laminariae]